MENSLYVVGKRSLLHNFIVIYAVFPNESYARKYVNVLFPMADVFCVPYHTLKLTCEGIEIPITSKII